MKQKAKRCNTATAEAPKKCDGKRAPRRGVGKGLAFFLIIGSLPKTSRKIWVQICITWCYLMTSGLRQLDGESMFSSPAPLSKVAWNSHPCRVDFAAPGKMRFACDFQSSCRRLKRSVRSTLSWSAIGCCTVTLCAKKSTFRTTRRGFPRLVDSSAKASTGTKTSTKSFPTSITAGNVQRSILRLLWPLLNAVLN